MCSKFTAVSDWKLAFHRRGVAVNDLAALMSDASVFQFMASPLYDEQGILLLATALMWNGVAMEIAGSSRPASGSEHLISHALDLTGARQRLHGLQTGTAAYLVSNLCFDPATLRHWIQRVRARGVTMPMFIGIAGPVDRARLLRMATKAGVSESARFLTGHTEWLLRLGTPTGYNPGRLLERTGATLADPASAVEGLHVFTFNQVRQTEVWRRSLLDRIAGRSQRPA